MELSQELLDEFDRNMRSYVTAILLNNEDDLTDVLSYLEGMKEHPAFCVMAMASYGAMIVYLLAQMSETGEPDEVFAIWSTISQQIEVDSILGS